jgi:NTE family protein
VVIAVNLNGDLVGQPAAGHYDQNLDRATSASPEFVKRVIDQVPTALRKQASAILPKLVRSGPTSPGYFDVLMNSLSVMQDHITRARLAGEPPHVMLMPRLKHIGLLEFNRAAETIAEGRACVDQALPFLKKYL